jgi:Mn-containing catalase
MKAFTAALESMGKDPFSIGKIPPTKGLVDGYFNDSTGVGDEGEQDAFGPWNQGGDWKIIEAPELEQGVENLNGRSAGKEVGAKRHGHHENSKPKVRKTA